MNWPSLTDSVMKACVDTFDEGAAIYSPLKSQPLQAPYPIKAIVDEAAFEALTDHQTPVISLQPMVGVRTADLKAAPRRGDQITLPRRGLYEIVEVLPDGQAGTVLKLRRLG